ncbi:MAG: DUF3889 domain-containing protein [Lysinibacillus sp.]
MRKILLAIGLFIAAALAVTYIPMLMNAEQETPSYEKWGKLAVEHIKEKYPNASLIDYLYVSRKTEQEATIETFKLWLREGSREFGVYVYIKFETATEEVIDIDTREESQ